MSKYFIPVVLLLTAGSGFAQTIFTGGTVNSADYSRSFAPGAIISIFGSGLATGTATATTFPLPTTLAGATVQVVGGLSYSVPIFYASPTQINAQLPFNLPTGFVTLQVSVGGQISNSDTINVATQAPKIFTLNFSGTGTAVVTTPQYQVLTAATPAKPADMIVLWMNSMGAVSGTAVAGQPAPGLNGTPYLTLATTPTVTINGVAAPVQWAGLVPGLSGLYQVNVQAPLSGITGPVAVSVSVGSANTQANVTVPYQQLGFYYTLTGGKSVTGQGLSGANAIAFRQSDALTWGNSGYNSWLDVAAAGLPPAFSASSGLALTLKNGANIVYDNNGIETNSYGTYYNDAGGTSDSQKPGLTEFYSMSNYFPAVSAGYFTLTQPTTITEIDGYFDVLDNVALPFDPSNPYVKYRMNIFSNNPSSLPTETGGYVGDVFTTDTAQGKFAYSQTSVQMISSVATNAPKTIYRLAFTPTTPLTLPAGNYWFTHDASVRTAPASSSTAQSVPVTVLTEMIKSQNVPKDTYRFNFFGQDFTIQPSWEIPKAMRVRPSSLIGQN